MFFGILFLVSVVTVLSPTVCLAQLGPPQPQIAPTDIPTPTYPVEGTVINSVTGEPIRAALVQLQGIQHMSRLTGADGRFHFDSVPQSQLAITVRKPGFFTEQEISQGSITDQTIQVGPGMRPLIMKLIPEGVIYGRITDSDGGPLQNLAITLIRDAVVNGQKIWLQTVGVQTKDDGEFRAFGLLPGTYYLKTGSWPFANRRSGANSQTTRGGYPRNYYPGTTDLDSATAIFVEPGREIQADFSVKREIFYRVSGSVIGASAQIPLNIQILGLDGEGLNGQIQTNPRLGTFTALVPKGSYVFKAYAGGDKGPQGVASQPVNVHGDIAGLSLAIAPLATIPVDVRFEIAQDTNSGTSPKDVQPVQVRLVSMGTRSINQSSYWAAMQGQPEDRSLEVRNIEPGRYSVEVLPNGHWYIESARCGQMNLFADDLSVQTGGPKQPIEIVVRDDFATLSGTVSLDGQPVGGTVLLIPEAHRGGIVTFPINPDGRFQRGDLPPGDYKAIAFDRVDGLEYMNTEAMRAYSPWEQVVHISPNGQATVQLELQKRSK